MWSTKARALVAVSAVAGCSALSYRHHVQNRRPALVRCESASALPPAVALAAATGAPVTTKTWTYYSGQPIADKDNFKLFSGNGNPKLAKDIAMYLDVELGKCDVSQFADGETAIQINENVRGKDVYVVQSTSGPVNDNYMELLLMVSCLRRSSAKRITVVCPYVGYARASVLEDKQIPISAKAIALMLETVGVDRVVAVDLHASQIQGFFHPQVPLENLESTKVGASYFADTFPESVTPMVVAIRTYSVARAKEFQKSLHLIGQKREQENFKNASLGMVIRNTPDLSQEPSGSSASTEREGEGQVEEQSVGIELVGIDKINEDVILVDDIFDTGRTICAAAHAVKQRGARKIYAFVTHGLFSPGALQRIRDSPIDLVVVTNTVAVTPREFEESGRKIVRLNLAPLLAETIRRMHEKESLGASVFRMTNNEPPKPE